MSHYQPTPASLADFRAVVDRRLRAAGLEADPGLERIQAWNHQARVAAELDPARAGHRNWRPAAAKRAHHGSL